jgi:hypothetical protein
MRTKQCKLIVVTECVKVEPITIWPFKNHLASPINVPIEEFVRNDGFESVDAFFEFFRRYKAEYLNDFEIIHWNTKLMVSGEAGEIRLQLGGDVSETPIGFATSPISKSEMGEEEQEEPGVCSLGYDMRRG